MWEWDDESQRCQVTNESSEGAIDVFYQRVSLRGFFMRRRRFERPSEGWEKNEFE